MMTDSGSENSVEWLHILRILPMFVSLVVPLGVFVVLGLSGYDNPAEVIRTWILANPYYCVPAAVLTAPPALKVLWDVFW